MARRRVPGPRTEARRRLIESLLAEREETGESYRELEERSGIPAPTLAWWQGRRRNHFAQKIELVEIDPVRIDATPAVLEIALPDGVVVRVPPRFDPELLGAVLALLRARSC